MGHNPLIDEIDFQDQYQVYGFTRWYLHLCGETDMTENDAEE